MKKAITIIIAALTLTAGVVAQEPGNPSKEEQAETCRAFFPTPENQELLEWLELGDDATELFSRTIKILERFKPADDWIESYSWHGDALKLIGGQENLEVCERGLGWEWPSARKYFAAHDSAVATYSKAQKRRNAIAKKAKAKGCAYVRFNVDLAQAIDWVTDGGNFSFGELKGACIFDPFGYEILQQVGPRSARIDVSDYYQVIVKGLPGVPIVGTNTRVPYFQVVGVTNYRNGFGVSVQAFVVRPVKLPLPPGHEAS